jgi:hypothetical protein
MKKPAATRKARRVRRVSTRTDAGVAHDWPIVVDISRAGARHADLVQRSVLSRTAMIRPTGALGRLPVSDVDARPQWNMPDRAAGPSHVPEEAITLDERFVRMIGPHQSVLLNNDAPGPVAERLAAAGCQVSLAEHADQRRPAALRKRGPSAVASTVERGTKHRARYDVVALHRILESVDDPVNVLNGFRKQLTDDGFVVAVMPNSTHGSIRLRMLAGRVPSDRSGSAPARFYDASSIKRLFEQAGFTIVRFERHLEPFDAVNTHFNVPLPPEFAAELMRDGDALTSAFVVMAYASPINMRTSLELRIRELAETQGQQRRALEDIRLATGQPVQREQVESLDQRLLALSGQVTNIKGDLDTWRDDVPVVSQTALRTTRDAILARTSELSTIGHDLHRLQYEQLVGRVRRLIEGVIAPQSVVLVVSKGDNRLTDLPHHVGWHFLQTSEGVYAGHHPAHSAAAIEALERLRRKGAAYLVFPHTAYWWLGHYDDFTRHLDRQFRTLVRDERTAVIYDVRKRRRRS